ncbi:SWIM zinc finger family protein [Micromonospora andamanensis]|uniref:SWIM zinc finger family protein n=2 Tax=Micromonospora andamanensis TaxID=1287068 RepID=UPI0035ED7D8F
MKHALGTAGRVGYDVADAAYFHRVMPYDAGRAERDNPRLVGARALLDAGAVQPDGTAATVRSGDQVYRVRQLADGSLTCTCPWWAKHRGQRGPCRHALATRMLTTEQVEERV